MGTTTWYMYPRTCWNPSSTRMFEVLKRKLSGHSTQQQPEHHRFSATRVFEKPGCTYICKCPLKGQDGKYNDSLTRLNRTALTDKLTSSDGNNLNNLNWSCKIASILSTAFTKRLTLNTTRDLVAVRFPCSHLLNFFPSPPSVHLCKSSCTYYPNCSNLFILAKLPLVFCSLCLIF